MFSRDNDPMLRQPAPEEYGQEWFKQEVAPYLSLGAEDTIKANLRSIEQETRAKGRHLLVSNDRYQLTAAHNVLAHNHFILAFCIGCRLSDSGPDFVAPSFTYNDAFGFVVDTFGAARVGMDDAGRVCRSEGFTAQKVDEEHLQQVRASLKWPDQQKVSRKMVHGGVDALNMIGAYTGMRVFGIGEQGSAIPDRFRCELMRRVQPLLDQNQSIINSFEYFVGGNSDFRRISSQQAMSEMYAKIRQSFALLNEIAVWTTMPRVMSRAFRIPPNLVIEEKPAWRRDFDPGALGAPVVRSEAASPLPPQLQQQRPGSVSNPPYSERPFDPNVLGPTVVARPPVSQHQQSRPFDASALRQEPSQSPSAQPSTERPFDPSILATSPEVTKKHEERPFDPLILRRPNKLSTKDTKGDNEG